jgi:hypothetical protein
MQLAALMRVCGIRRPIDASPKSMRNSSSLATRRRSRLSHARQPMPLMH